jgi:hypothetical protein
MSLTAQTVRGHLPVPHLKSRTAAIWLGVGLAVLGAVWLYDAYDGAGRQGPWPVSTLFPW